MERVALKSNAVASAGYDPERRELELEFSSGRVYRYFDVPPGIYDWLLRTPSKGSFVSRMIDDRFSYREVVEDGPPPAPDALLRQLLASLSEASDERERDDE